MIERLLKDGLAVKTGSGLTVSRLSALLLAKRLEDFPDVKRHAPRVITYKNDDKLQTRQDQGGTLGYAVGFQRQVRYVMQQLPRREVVKEGGLRVEETLVPEIAIRELVANSLIHQDLTITGVGPSVEIFADRVEV